jgi:hypothetical protein
MKKQILGIAVFVLIVGITFSFFQNGWFRLIPVSEMRAEYETPEDNSQLDLNDITFDILNAKYDSETNRVTQELRFFWKGEGNPPKSITVNYAFFTSQTNLYRDFNSTQVNLIFNHNKNADVIVQNYFEADPTKNYYTDVWINNTNIVGTAVKSKITAKNSPILFVH